MTQPESTESHCMGLCGGGKDPSACPSGCDPEPDEPANVPAVDPARVARCAEASTLTPEVIAAMWRGHADCTWVSTGHDVVWSCGIIHPRPIYMQPTTRDRHFAALLRAQIDADAAVADAELAELRAEVERLEAIAASAPRVEIRTAVGRPTECKVWIAGVLRFDGTTGPEGGE